MENSPQTFGAFLKSYFKGLWQTIKHPLALLPTIVITGAWIALGIAQTRLGNEPWLSWLNFFTFAQGGLFGGVAGAIGGILGKILIAAVLNAMVLPLFIRDCRPFAKFGGGFKGFFRSFAFDGMRALSTFLMGIAIALAVYSFFNITQRWEEGLVGVAGAVMLIRSIGQKGGLVFSALFSMGKAFRKKSGGPSYMGITRFLSGMSIGFVAGTGLNAFGLRWAIFIALCAFALSLLFFIFGKRQRAAFATACIAAMIFIPTYAQDGDVISQATNQLRQAGGDLQAGQDELSKILNGNISDYNKKIEDINRRIEEANRRGDERELERLSQELASLYMGMAGSSMDMYNQYRNNLESQSNGGNGYDSDDSGSDYGDGDGDYGDDRPSDSFGDYDDSHDNEYDSGGGYGDGSGFEDFYNDAKDVAMEGWSDESSRVEDENDVTMLEGLGAASALGGAAGAAAGAAGGGAAGGGGFPTPDFPDGEGPDWEARDPEEKRDEEYDGEYDDEDTEGGDGGDDDIPEESKGGWMDVPEDDVEPGDGFDPEDSESGEEEYENEYYDGTEESEEPGDEGDYEEEEPDSEQEDSEEDEAEDDEEEDEEQEPEEEQEEPEDEAEDDSENNSDQDDNGDYEDTGSSDNEGVDEEADQEDEPSETEGAQEETEETSEPEQQDEEPQEDQEEEEVDDYDYEAERKAREEEQRKIDEKYKRDFDKDYDKFSQTSDEERVAKEAEQAMKDQEEWEKYKQMFDDEEKRQEKIREYFAPKLGVPTVDENGNPREIWDIQHDCERAVLWNKNRGIYMDHLGIQQICSEVELESSLRISEFEMTDKVAEGTVNVMAEYVPGGKYVKDAHGFVKSTAVSGLEAYHEGRSVVGGLTAGAAKGTINVIQNHAGDIADTGGLEGATKFAYTGVVNVLGEADKELIDGIEKGKDRDEVFQNVQNAIIKKTGEHLVNSGLGATGMSDEAANITTEFIMRGHDELKFGEGDDAKTISEVIGTKINDMNTAVVAQGTYMTGVDSPETYMTAGAFLPVKNWD